MVRSPAQHRDFYQILGVPCDANAETIKGAFHQLARRYHPDRSEEADAEERFKEITGAYTVLADPGRRAEYDARLRDAPSDMGAPARFGRPGHGRVFTFGLNLDDDLLSRSFVGGRRGGDAFGTGSDIRLEVEIPLAAVASGTGHMVGYSRLFPCLACGGRGTRAGTSLRLCSACGGAGRVPRRGGHGDTITACEHCGGTGLVVDELCLDCAGTGLRPGREWLKVRIPAGIEDGTVLRVRGRGSHGRQPGGRWGDLYLVVRSAPDPDIVRSGADLWRRESIPVADAVLGRHLEVARLGQTVGVDVPAGSQPGTLLRLAGYGLPRFGSGDHGDLYVVVGVVIPSTLSSDERALYEQLRGAPRRSRRWPWRRKPRPATGTAHGAEAQPGDC